MSPIPRSPIDDAAVDAAFEDVTALPPSRIPAEMGRASREQPELLAFILGSTDGMGPGISELAGFIYCVVWRVFRGQSRRQLPQVTAAAIQRKLRENEERLAGLDGADPQTIDAALIAPLTSQPALFRYVIEAIAVAEEDENHPVEMSPEEKGALVLLLATAIDVLDDAYGESQAGA